MKIAKAISFFALAMGAGFGSSQLLAQAAVGDAIYRAGGQQQCITAPQAACYADCAIADGTWDGNRADMIKAKAFRTGSCPSGFGASVVGHKSAPLASVPEGSVVDGVVTE